MSKRPARDGPSPGNPANIKLDAVNPLWLRVSEEERYAWLRGAGPSCPPPGCPPIALSPRCRRYLLLEDDETGDVLLPLIYMKAFFEVNYSRKLSSLRHRTVCGERLLERVCRANVPLPQPQLPLAAVDPVTPPSTNPTPDSSFQLRLVWF